MTKITVQQTNVEDTKPAVKHSVGQYYLIQDEVYVLAQTDCSIVNLVGLLGANRYADPVPIRDVSAITQQEFNKLFKYDQEWRLLSSVDVRYTL